MSKHTPGPWMATVDDDGEHLEVQGANGVIVVGGCGCCGSPFMQVANPQADASLIAAAPDLLAALRLVWNSIDRVNHPAAVAVSAAIAEAEGRS